jgi:hypothetical protein
MRYEWKGGVECKVNALLRSNDQEMHMGVQRKRTAVAAASSSFVLSPAWLARWRLACFPGASPTVGALPLHPSAIAKAKNLQAATMVQRGASKEGRRALAAGRPLVGAASGFVGTVHWCVVRVRYYSAPISTMKIGPRIFSGPAAPLFQCSCRGRSRRRGHRCRRQVRSAEPPTPAATAAAGPAATQASGS